MATVDVAAAEPTDDKVDNVDLLALVREERRRAVGFEQDYELKADRERALLYFKGDVSSDIPTLPNRSKAVSSDVADAVETLLPDLIEIFLGGDDVVAFIPQNEADEEAAKQETAYLHHVAFQDNPGFLNFYTAIKDALLLKTGVFHWEWEEDRDEQDEDFTGKNVVEMHLAMQDGEISNVVAEPIDPNAPQVMDPATGQPQQPQPTYSFTITKERDLSRAKYWAVAPEDFAAAADTVDIAETTYCVERQRPRVQDLIALGFDEDKVRALEPYAFATDMTTQRARDTAGENTNQASTGDNTSDELRQVEVHKHCIRVLEGKKTTLYCIYTDAQEAVELYKEEIDSIPYAVGSPYLVPHRLIGRSVADVLIEIMKIKTALYRMCLDSGYFALNQRSEVAMDQANDYTISDLLRNEPSAPVRSKSGTAVRALQAGPLNFDPYQAIEFFSTVAEGRTGIVRNAQGLNPDTLHDTAKGAMMLLSAAQKRTRMIARVLAETLVKPLFLGLHSCIRQNAKSTSVSRLLGKWTPVDPTRWAERTAMTVEVGLGAAGKDAEIAAMLQIQNLQKAIVEGGGAGTLVTEENIYKSATDMSKKLGVKQPEEYFTDPASTEAQQAKAQKAQQPNPEMAAVQGEQQLQQAKQQGELQLQSAKQQAEQSLSQLKMQADKEIQANKSQMQAAADQHKQELEHQRELQMHADNMQLEQLKYASAERIEQLKLESAERIAIATARIRAEGAIAAAVAKGNAQAASDTLAYEMNNEGGVA
jgi:hypothetical protein